jgi:hypothetical protein
VHNIGKEAETIVCFAKGIVDEFGPALEGGLGFIDQLLARVESKIWDSVHRV